MLTLLVKASTVSVMCLAASTMAVQSCILQIEPSPSLLQGSKVQLWLLAHAQFASNIKVPVQLYTCSSGADPEGWKW